MLRKPCACKGSIANIHEACLAKWLLQRNIRECELCKHPFNVKEEYGSPIEIIKKAFGYCFSSNRRVLKLLIYAVYLYLFFQRISFVVKYYKDALVALVMAIVRPSKGKDKNVKRLRLMLRFGLMSVNFFYNSFILVQLCCIGFTESHRIKQLYVKMHNSVKRLRIYDWKQL